MCEKGKFQSVLAKCRSRVSIQVVNPSEVPENKEEQEHVLSKLSLRCLRFIKLKPPW